MRNLQRNCQPFYYSLYIGEAYRTDANGYRTTEKILTYSEPVYKEAPISARTGQTDIQLFGTELNYDRVIYTTEKLPIDEYSLLYVETEPDLENYSDGTKADYQVKKSATYLNQYVYAIKKRCAIKHATNSDDLDGGNFTDYSSGDSIDGGNFIHY